MDRILRPGMRLMRRLSLTRKFSVIAVLLVLPLAISITGGYRDSTGQIDFTQRERAGLEYAAPVARLMVEITILRAAVAEGRDVAAVPLGAVEEVDAVDRRLGEVLGVRDQWASLRGLLVSLPTADTDADQLAALTGNAADRAGRLMTAVADASYLILDPQLDSHYVMIVMVEHLPRLMEASVRVVELHRASSTRDQDDRQAQLLVAARDIQTVNRTIRTSLGHAYAASEWPGLRATTAGQVAALSERARDVTDGLLIPHDAPVPHVEPDAEALTTAGFDLTDALRVSLDTLLLQRIDALNAKRLQPFFWSMVALAGAMYLFLGLFRSTANDVRSVLVDISSVTDGAIQQSDPLDGPDEFGQMSRAVLYARDRLTAAIGELSYVARHDALTSLGNRHMLVERLGDLMGEHDADGAREDTTLAVALLELDGFKDINDSFGHGIGDKVLLALTQRFIRSTDRHDIVARLGGDDFGIVLTGVRDADDARTRVEVLKEVVEQPILVGGRRMHVRVTSGIAVGDGTSRRPVELLRDAEVAKSAARDLGPGGTSVFTPCMQERTRERVELSADLVQAVEQGEFSLAFQPIVELSSGQVHGLEALVRWLHPTRGAVGPDTFIPLAEATGLIQPIGRWVLREAALQLAAWTRHFPDGYPLRMDVNVSAAQLQDDYLATDVLSVLEETGLEPGSLVLEITESALMSDVEGGTRRLRQLAAVGVQLALDDFGTGYSSLAYLRRLPVNVLKIDKSFVVNQVSTPGQEESLLRSIVGLGLSLGLQTVAEGIETAAQEEFLRSAGCHLGQGYLYSTPLSASEMTAFLTASPARTPVVPQQRGEVRDMRR